MRMIRTSRMLLAAGVALAMFAANALAQTPGGAFSQLSAGQQKIARALFEGQPPVGAPNAPKPLTLDEIAALKKKGHEGWGEVFKAMKKQGLVTQKNLGEVVSGYEHRHPETATLDKKVDKAEKPEKMDKPEKMEKPEKPGRR